MVFGERSLGRPLIDVDERRLVGSRCPVCGDLRFPPVERCVDDATPADEALLGPVGVVYEVVEVFVAPVGFEVPYFLGFVDLEEGVRVMARIAGDVGAAPSSEDQVTLEPRSIGMAGEVNVLAEFVARR